MTKELKRKGETTMRAPMTTAVKASLGETASRFLNSMLFQDRGLSHRTVDALVAWGIDMPERLLFTPEADLKRIPGIGPAALAEIMRYRAKFLRGD